jgi:hypothetical protein
MWNAGKVPARMIEVIQPAGFEGFFWELAEHLAAGPPDPPAVSRIADRYGLIFADAPWLPGIIARYQLEPLPEVPPS